MFFLEVSGHGYYRSVPAFETLFFRKHPHMRAKSRSGKPRDVVSLTALGDIDEKTEKDLTEVFAALKTKYPSLKKLFWDFEHPPFGGLYADYSEGALAKFKKDYKISEEKITPELLEKKYADKWIDFRARELGRSVAVIRRIANKNGYKLVMYSDYATPDCAKNYGVNWEYIRSAADEVYCGYGREKKSVCWRYDPILITDKYTVAYHIEAFAQMAADLSAHTDSCVISFLDVYEKTKRNFPEGRAVTREERLAIGQAFAEIGKRYGIEIFTCAEGDELVEFGMNTTGCQSRQVLERAIGLPLEVPKSAMTREGCQCVLGCDIGTYHSCGHGCLYCYANYDRKTVEENMQKHDPNSPFLVGGFMDGDIIKSAEQKSWIREQISFDDFLNL